MELEQLGWNALTISIIGTFCFSVLGNFGLWKQNRAIWQARSGESVSILFMSFSLAYFVAGFMYGLNAGLKMLIFHCAGRITFHIPILIGLWKYKGFARSDKLLSTVFLSAALITYFPYIMKIMFLMFSVGNVLAYLAQPWEIFWNKSKGTVEPKLHLVYCASSTFWSIYGFTLNDPVLKVSVPPNILISILVIALCLKYKNTSKQVALG